MARTGKDNAPQAPQTAEFAGSWYKVQPKNNNIINKKHGRTKSNRVCKVVGRVY
jgi:hypothetical protein